MSKQSFNTFFGEILIEWLLRYMRNVLISKTAKKFLDFVFNLSEDEFNSIKEAVVSVIDKDKYGFNSFEEATLKYGRKPVCPKCGSTSNHEDGYTDSNHKRYEYKECSNRYILLSNSIFNSVKRYLYRFASMRIENLQSYLNWFIC